MKNQNEHKAGYKHTPLGWIPEEWEVQQLSKITLDFKSGEGITSSHISNVGKFPVYGGNGLRGYTTNYTHDGKYVLIGRQGALCGNILLVTGKSYISEHAIAVSVNGKTSLKWLGYHLTYRNLNRLSESSAQPGLAVNKLLKLKIPVPTLAEQCKIAAILSTWDEAITKNQQLIAQLQQRNKGLMQQLLTGKKRLKGFEGEWRQIHLSEAFTERSETGNSNLNLLSVGSLGIYPQSQSDKRDISNTDKSKYKRICPGDIGYNTMRMWQGRSALSDLEGIVSPAYTIVKSKTGQCSLFYAFLLKLGSVVHKFFRNSQGLVEDTLNCKFRDFAKVKVNVPVCNEQIAIANVLSKTVEEIQLYEKKLKFLQQQKKGLMQKLLTGEIRVKVDNN